MDILNASALSFQHVQERPPNKRKRGAEEVLARRKGAGKKRFVGREATGSILIWFIVLPAVEVFVDHGRLFSLHFLNIWLIMLPIFLLGGYLNGSWKWKDLEKKYRE
jgi:hypothetical protein